MAIVHCERGRDAIHPIAPHYDAEVRAALQHRRQRKPVDEFLEDDSEQKTTKQIRAPLSRTLLTIMSLVTGYLLISSIATNFTLHSSSASSVRQTPFCLGNLAACKAELVGRLQKLVDVTQQDVIVNLFSPVKRSSSNSFNVITCATQGDVRKLPRLQHLTSRWLGPVSFAILISSESDLDFLFQFWTDNPLLQQYVSVHVLMELPQVQRKENGRYPINQLRNLALHNVKTGYVFLNDIDFVPSDHAHDEIASLIKESPLPAKTFWVLPAFERLSAPAQTTNIPAEEEEEVLDVAMVPKTKPKLLTAIQQDRVVTTFHPYFPPGHGPTNFEKWYTYNDTSTTMMYPIDYAAWFEPYVVCNTQDLHQFFPLFRGFGLNKNSFFVEAKIRNFTYYVLSRQFVVHMNHKGRSSRNSQDNSHLDPILLLFEDYLVDTYHLSNDAEFYYRSNPK